jgi:predicted ester cyclase
LDDVGSILTEDFKGWLSISNETLSKKEFVEKYQYYKTSFSNINHELMHKFEDENNVLISGIFRGTKSSSNPVDLTNKKEILLHFTSLFEVDNSGKIKSMNMQFDNESLEFQIKSEKANSNLPGEQSVKELFHAMDDAGIEKIATYCSNVFTFTSPFFLEHSSVVEFQKLVASLKVAFPDMKNEITSITSEGKHVTTRGVFTGTNNGSIMGNPPTGNKINLPFLIQDELDSKGKIKNRILEFDVKSLEIQLMNGVTGNDSMIRYFKIMEINSMVNRMNMYIDILQV